MRPKRTFQLTRKHVFDFLKIIVGLLLLYVAESVRQMVGPAVADRVWLWVAFLSFGYFNLMCAGVALCLVPFRANRVVDLIVEILLWPIGITQALLHFTIFFASPFMVVFFLLVFFISFVLAAQAVGWLAAGDLKPYLYPFLFMLFLTFSLKGNTVLALWLRFYAPKEDFTKLMPLYRPKMMRFYLYALTAAVYLVAKQEQFAGATLIPLEQWGTYKDMVSEVLLSFVTIDAVLGAWRERTS